MGTRGFLGIRNNKKLITGKYTPFDSYYDSLGKEVINYYFDGEGDGILELTDGEKDKGFLQNGLFCEYAYIYNEDNDTLEIYRGCFTKKQAFDIKNGILNELERSGKEEYYCHLIIIVDKKKHTKKEVLKSFRIYFKVRNKEGADGDEPPYPEREIIPLNLPKNYVLMV